MKKVKVIIKSENILELQEAASKGDIIDLKETLEVDTYFILQAIKDKKDAEYERLLKLHEEKQKEQEEARRVKYEKEKDEEIAAVKNKLERLEEQQENLAKIKVQEAEAKKVEEINKLKEEISELKNKIQLNEASIESRITKEKAELSEANIKLQGDLKHLQSNYDLQVKNIENEYNQKVNVLETELSTIKRERASQTVAKIGQNLESWCDEQFKAATTYGFKTSTWEKDTLAVKGDDTRATKGDYIFKVYATDAKEILVTSAMIEMKSEELTSENKQKNSDHYKKLHKDREKKGLEYAILVSELEYELESDAPIFVAPGYEKMYVVRPPYFLTLLGIIESIGLKYADILTSRQEEMLEFEDRQKILDDFEKFKNEILNNSLRHIETHVDNIAKEASKVQDSAANILESVRIITESHLQTVRNKIENFSITSLVNKIHKLD